MSLYYRLLGFGLAGALLFGCQTQEKQDSLEQKIEQKASVKKNIPPDIEKEMNSIAVYGVIEKDGIGVFYDSSSYERYLKSKPAGHGAVAVFNNKEEILNFLKERREGRTPKRPHMLLEDGDVFLRCCKTKDSAEFFKKLEEKEARWKDYWNFPYFIKNDGTELSKEEFMK